METYSDARPLAYAPAETVDLYPESDGKPMAETERHFREILKTFSRLENHFKSIPDIYVLGDMMMYYEEGNPHKSISPDIFVSFGVGRKERRTYKIWEEGKPPDFVLEFASKKTHKKDLIEKKQLYAKIGISEYFLHDVDGLYLPTALIGFRLVDQNYVEISTNANNGIPAVTLGLEFHLIDGEFSMYDPIKQEWLKTRAENAEERAENAEERAENAELETAQLREEIERLKAQL